VAKQSKTLNVRALDHGADLDHDQDGSDASRGGARARSQSDGAAGESVGPRQSGAGRTAGSEAPQLAANKEAA
jgi:hypothetical protein